MLARRVATIARQIALNSRRQPPFSWYQPRRACGSCCPNFQKKRILALLTLQRSVSPRFPGCVRRCPLPPLRFPPSRPLGRSDRPAASLLQGRCEGGLLLGRSPVRGRSACRLDGDGWGRCPITGSCTSPAATARLSEPVRVCECGVPASGGASHVRCYVRYFRTPHLLRRGFPHGRPPSPFRGGTGAAEAVFCS